MVLVKIESVGEGQCALTNRTGEGLTVAFDNEAAQFLTWKGFRQILAWKTAPNGSQPTASVNDKKLV